ncbi:hypothetical protein NE237_031629 [Protea cynaroides]|uniref:Uncharacterized protein n=1 Tax=Protea cynaroides TaxID=273540 RepID=A0A9Q0L1S2_9MAGN|nr:hypothetical protein NE237_031629 [Protea cynaroides]
MLSVENPPDPDPSCSTQTSLLKTEESASDGRALQEAELLKQGLGDTDNALHKFSIRDYVFAGRSKDICANWPFPKQYLQLCLKHGIKDPLPPFETPDSVRNQCSSKIALAGSDQTVGQLELEGSFGRESAGNVDGESCRPFDPLVLGSAEEAPSEVEEQEKLTVPEDESLCQLVSGLNQGVKGNNIPSKLKLNSHAQCGSESSPTSTTRLPLSASVEFEVAGTPCTIPKPGIATESKGKKCRLIVKLGSFSSLSNTDYYDGHTLNTDTTISDSMASKLCPVCKIFSSTSNTALNAHIDQCLAVESSSKLTRNSKLTKHGVKPRKKRSMVDICASAPRCTLEELDRRNGSNWAADSSLTSATVQVCTHWKKQRLSHSHMPLPLSLPLPLPLPLEGNEEEDGAVYFDSNGTKLRILSTFKDTPVPTVEEDFKSRKHMRDGKDINNFSTVKRRRIEPRHSKYMKLKPEIQSLSQKTDSTEIYGTSGRKSRVEESLKKEESLSQLLKVCDQIKPSESGAVGRWVCSKRTGLTKKFCGQDGSHNPNCPSLVLMNPHDDNDQSGFSNYSMERNHICKLPNSSGDPISSLKSKRVRNLSYGAPVISNKKKCSNLPAGGYSRLSKGRTSSEHECIPRSLRNHAALSPSMRVESHADPVKSSEGFPKVASQPSWTSHILSAKGKNSTLKRKIVLVGAASPTTKVNEEENHFTCKESRMHRSIAKTVDHAQAFPSDLYEEYDQGHNIVGNQSRCINQMEGIHKLGSNNIVEPEKREITDEVTLDKGNAHEPEEGRLLIIASEKERSIALGNLQSVPNCGSFNLAANADSQVEHGYCSKNAPVMFDYQEPGTEETHVGEKDTVIKLSPEKIARGSTVTSSKNFSSESHELSSSSNIRSINLPSIGKHKRPIYGTEVETGPPKLFLVDDLGMDCADEIGSCSIGKNNHLGLEAGLKVTVEDSLSEVYVIRIPGPPGPTLPSPQGSEVLQESSSLTSSRVSSFQERFVLADRDSSGSPVSTTSAISNLHKEGTDLKHSELESFARPPIEGKIANFAYHSTNLVVRDTTISPSMGLLDYSADQTCCCLRKEGTFWAAAEMHEKSNFPWQCMMTPAMLPAKGKQMSSEQSFWPETLASLSICRNLGIDQRLAPILELPTSPIALKSCLAATVNFPSLNDADSAPPSSHAQPQTTSHPVLRLMGKNLMVENQDEDPSIKLREIMPAASNGDPIIANYLTLLGYSNLNAPDEDCVSMHRTVLEAPVVVSHQDSCDTSTQCYDLGLPNGFRNLCDSEAHQMTLLGVNCSNMHVEGSATSSLQPNLLHQEGELNNKPNPPFTYVDRVFSSPQPQHRCAVPATEAVASPIQEVIIIDGSPENDADLRMRNSNTTEGLRGNQPSPVGILASTASNSNLTQVSPFPCFLPRNAYMLRQPPVRPKPSFLVSCPGGDSNPVKWKGT